MTSFLALTACSNLTADKSQIEKTSIDSSQTILQQADTSILFSKKDSSVHLLQGDFIDRFMFNKSTHYKIIDQSGKVVLEGDGEYVIISSLNYGVSYYCDYGGKWAFEFKGGGQHRSIR